MILVTTDFVPGKEIKKNLGLVRGNTIRARHIGRDIKAGLKNIVVEEAEGLGANAILNVRFATSMIMQSAAEILAYGTAVVVS